MSGTLLERLQQKVDAELEQYRSGLLSQGAQRVTVGQLDNRAGGLLSSRSELNVHGASLDNRGGVLVADAGLDVQVSRNATVSLSYDGQLARHAVDSGFKGGFAWRF